MGSSATTSGYGVFLNIHPGGKAKRVTLHGLPCSHYKQHKKGKLGAKDTYTFHKDCSTFREAMERCSLWALEWHAPIKPCADCLKASRLP